MKLRTQQKALNSLLITLLLGLVLVTPVKADGQTGQYGSTTDTTDKPREEVTHEPVDAGIEDINLLTVAGMAGAIGGTLYILSKVTARVYLLD